MNVLRTLKNNARDIVAFLLIAVAFCVLLDLLGRWSAHRDEEGRTILGLATFITLLVGFSKFTAANVCAWLLGMAVAWPEMNRWSHDSDEVDSGVSKPSNNMVAAFRKLSSREKCFAFIAVALGEMVMAAMCFGGGA